MAELYDASCEVDKPLTTKQELRYLSWIVKRIMRLSEPSKAWLMSFCADELGMRHQQARCSTGSLIHDFDGGQFCKDCGLRPGIQAPRSGRPSWSCTTDGVTEPCGDCDGCRYDRRTTR